MNVKSWITKSAGDNAPSAVFMTENISILAPLLDYARPRLTDAVGRDVDHVVLLAPHPGLVPGDVVRIQILERSL